MGMVVCLQMDDEFVVIDVNHPLAGVVLNFEVELVAIDKASTGETPKEKWSQLAVSTITITARTERVKIAAVLIMSKGHYRKRTNAKKWSAMSTELLPC